MSVRILFLGEVVGIPTVKAMGKKLFEIINKNRIDFTMANCDGASDGYGLLKNTAYELNQKGIDAITTGECVFNKKDVKELLRAPFLLRPYNLPNAHGGKGYYIFTLGNGIKIGIVNILGRANFTKIFPMDPFYSTIKAVEKIEEEVKIIIVDFHGATTSEIQALQWHLAGRVSLAAGTHMRVLTADNRILKNKTAVITCNGFCGGYYSIGGLEKDIEIQKIKHGIFSYSKVERNNVVLQGIIAEIDENTGTAVSIELFSEMIG